MINSPLISVVMSVYNDAPYIKEALDSLLIQSLQDFEVIIIDDCSTDNTLEIIKNYKESRFHIVKNSENRGLTINLNKAIELARGKYIARMDGDDICLPERFEKQIQYLEAHPKLMLISCRTSMFGEESMISAVQGTPQELKAMMLIRPVLAHPGFMMRSELINENNIKYDETYYSAQDYDYAVRVAEKYDIGITSEVLLKYRIHKKQISSSKFNTQFTNADRVRKYQLEKLGISLNTGQEEVYRKWAKEEKCRDLNVFLEAQNIIEIIAEANNKKRIFHPDVLTIILKELLYLWVIRNKSIYIYTHIISICCYKGENIMIFMKQIMKVLKSKLNRGLK